MAVSVDEVEGFEAFVRWCLHTQRVTSECWSGRVPTLSELQRWTFDGVAEATDGCLVEPDGHCPHGCPSWLLVLGLI